MISAAAIAERADVGLIRRVWHPSGTLQILNYTERCAYAGAWDEVTLACRGLILDADFNVVARPFAKFFNYGQPGAPDLDLDAYAVVSDKADGSLGILYPDPTEGGWAVATRGSFTSDQAVHATARWKDKYQGYWQPPPGTTALFEIVYPANRIVVDYGDLDDLVMLDLIDNKTGAPFDVHNPFYGWGGPRVDRFEYATLREALEARPRPGMEGLVVFFPDLNDRVKIKQEDYLAVHRIVFGLTKRRVWERVAAFDLARHDLTVTGTIRYLGIGPEELGGILTLGDDWMTAVLDAVPDEFGDWVTKQARLLLQEADDWCDAVTAIYVGLGPVAPADRKAWAAEIQGCPADIRPALFALLDGKQIRGLAWKAIRPDHEPYRADDPE